MANYKQQNPQKDDNRGVFRKKVSQQFDSELSGDVRALRSRLNSGKVSKAEIEKMAREAKRGRQKRASVSDVVYSYFDAKAHYSKPLKTPTARWQKAVDTTDEAQVVLRDRLQSMANRANGANPPVAKTATKAKPATKTAVKTTTAKKATPAKTTTQPKSAVKPVNPTTAQPKTKKQLLGEYAGYKEIPIREKPTEALLKKELNKKGIKGNKQKTFISDYLRAEANIQKVLSGERKTMYVNGQKLDVGYLKSYGRYYMDKAHKATLTYSSGVGLAVYNYQAELLACDKQNPNLHPKVSGRKLKVISNKVGKDLRFGNYAKGKVVNAGIPYGSDKVNDVAFKDKVYERLNTVSDFMYAKKYSDIDVEKQSNVQEASRLSSYKDYGDLPFINWYNYYSYAYHKMSVDDMKAKIKRYKIECDAKENWIRALDSVEHQARNMIEEGKPVPNSIYEIVPADKIIKRNNDYLKKSITSAWKPVSRKK